MRMPMLVWTCCERPSTRRPALTSTCCGDAAWTTRARISACTSVLQKKTGRGNYPRPVCSTVGAQHAAPLHQSASLARRERLAVGVQETDLAVVQLSDPGLDLGPIAHDHPYQVIGTDRFLGRARRVGNRQPPHALRIRLVVVIVQAERHELLERALHSFHRFPVAGQRERQVRLRLCELVGSDRSRSSYPP